METKVYWRKDGDYGYSLVPFNTVKWTGRWKIETISETYKGPPGYVDRERGNMITKTTTMLYLERQFGIFPFNLIFPTVWESENDFTMREEEFHINECVEFG